MMELIRSLSLSLLLSIVLRQFFWSVDTQIIAWFFPVTLSLVFFYLSFFKNQQKQPFFELSRLIYILPLLFFFLLRIVWPDVGYDTSLYHISLGTRSLLGYPHMNNDFFPNGAFLVSPITDMYLELFRLLLGYRLGPIGNLFILLWIALTVEKFFATYKLSNVKRSFFVLLVLSCEFCIMELNTYMVDLIPAALFLEATWLLYSFDDDEKKNLFFIPALLGIGFACKFTGVFFVIPLGLWYLKIAWEKKLITTAIPVGTFLIALPYMPTLIFVYNETGNPLFPIFNNFFKSSLWPANGFKDTRWGPINAVEYIFWPVMSAFKQSRLSEFGVYSGRICISFIFALLLVVKRKKVLMSLLFFCSALLWSYVGYIRYALFLELLGGILILFFILESKKYRYVSYAVLTVLVMQAGYAGFLSFEQDWAWRPKKASYDSQFVSSDYMENVKYLFNDHSARNFMIPASADKTIDDVEQWVLCDNWQPIANVAFLLKASIPVISISQREDSHILGQPDGKKQFEELMERVRDKKTVALTTLFGGRECLSLLKKYGFRIVGGPPKVDLPVMGRQYAFLHVQYVR